MNFPSIWVILCFSIAFIVTFATTPIAKIVAHKIGAIDTPKDERRVHKLPIPRLGGLAIFYGFIVSVLSFIELNKSIRGIILGSLLIVILGILDDVKELGAKVKCLIQIVAALIVALHGVKIEFLTNPNIFSIKETVSLGFLSIPFTVLWIVGVTNAINLIDGLDGLAAGISSIASIAFFVIALLVSEAEIAMITAALAGACIGFLPYNFNPAKIFMGDTGATFLGFILATISIEGLFKGYAVVSFAVPLLILGLPIFDTGYAILRRMTKGQPIMEADRGHLHHRLLDMGFSQKQTVIILYTMSAILGLSAVILAGSGALRAMGLILSVLIIVFAGAKYMHVITPINIEPIEVTEVKSPKKPDITSENENDPK